MNSLLGTTLVSMASVMLVTAVHAADEYYAPPVEHPVQVYFGDPHLHTSISMDAGAWGALALHARFLGFNRKDRLTIPSS